MNTKLEIMVRLLGASIRSSIPTLAISEIEVMANELIETAPDPKQYHPDSVKYNHEHQLEQHSQWKNVYLCKHMDNGKQCEYEYVKANISEE